MLKSLSVRDFEVVIVAQNHNPTILNPDFLTHSQIVPSEWELAEPPLCADPVAQVKYKNGIRILAQPQTVTFGQSLIGRAEADICVSEIASKYVSALPHVDYRAVGTNPKGHVVTDSVEEAQRFAIDRFVAPGPWTQFGDQPVRASVQFTFAVNGAVASFRMEWGSLPLPDSDGVPAVLFAANFHRDIQETRPPERVARVVEILRGWRSDLDTFHHVVEHVFLGQEKHG